MIFGGVFFTIVCRLDGKDLNDGIIILLNSQLSDYLEILSRLEAGLSLFLSSVEYFSTRMYLTTFFSHLHA